MTDINLLPWREEQREFLKRQFFASLLLTGLMVVLIMGMVYLFINHQISGQKYRNNLLRVEIRLYDRQIKEIRQLKTVRRELIARMGVIQQLQENRPLIVHFFDEMIRVLPREVYLIKLVRNGHKLTISGLAQSNTMVSELMRNIEKNIWLRKPLLNEIKKAKGKQASGNEFRLKTLLKSKSKVTPRNDNDKY